MNLVTVVLGDEVHFFDEIFEKAEDIVKKVPDAKEIYLATERARDFLKDLQRYIAGMSPGALRTFYSKLDEDKDRIINENDVKKFLDFFEKNFYTLAKEEHKNFWD